MKAAIVSCIVGLVMMASLSGSPAAAEVVTFKRANGWEAFGGRSNDDRKLCGVSADGGGRWFSVKYFEGESRLTIQLSKDTWKVRNGIQIAVTMQFDDESPWRAKARTFHMNDGDAALEFSIGRDDVGQWIREFRASNTLYIRFPDSDVEAWQADLSGTPQIADAMTECLKVMMKTR